MELETISALIKEYYAIDVRLSGWTSESEQEHLEKRLRALIFQAHRLTQLYTQNSNADRLL